MIELAPNIFYLPGKNGSHFPYCSCLYLKGREMRVLIDAGMGANVLEPVKRMGIDLLILSHSHLDHRLTRREIPEVPVWCHAEEEIYLLDQGLFFEGTGLSRSGLDLTRLHAAAGGVFQMAIGRRLVGGESIDLGWIRIHVLHTPGHTPGHLAFHIPEADLLFSADVDLTPFGPYYGHDFADIDAFIRSIDRLRRLEAGTVVTGHAGPFSGEVSGRFDAYGAVVSKRDRRTLRYLDRPRILEDFRGKNLIYRKYPLDGGLVEWFELVHISKHLVRLARKGEVQEEAGLWRRS